MAAPNDTSAPERSRTRQTFHWRVQAQILAFCAIVFAYLLFTEQGQLTHAIVERLLNTLTGASL